MRKNKIKLDLKSGIRKTANKSIDLLAVFLATLIRNIVHNELT